MCKYVHLLTETGYFIFMLSQSPNWYVVNSRYLVLVFTTFSMHSFLSAFTPTPFNISIALRFVVYFNFYAFILLKFWQ